MIYERINPSRALLAVAVFALAAMALGTYTIAPRVQADEGVIDVLNVGTCITSDDSIFEVEDCDDGSGNYDVGADGEIRDGRDEIVSVSRDDLYATYAHDPKTSSESPRAILHNADLLKVSISDPGRDRRDGVLIRAAGADNTIDAALQAVIDNALDDVEDPGFGFTNTNRYFHELTGGASNSHDFADIETSGPIQFGFTGNTVDPMATDGVIKVFGFRDNTNGRLDSGSESYVELIDDNLLTLDEDLAEGSRNGSGSEPDIHPWLTLNASVPNNSDLQIVAIYYQTSDTETLVGGREEDDSAYSSIEEKPVYTQDEIDGEDPLIVQVEGDNDEGEVNLFLEETGRFTGRYEGYIRLTDADGDGTQGSGRDNWGIELTPGTDSDENGAAVVGVQSGPVRIRYKDTDGRTQTFVIQIDLQPPAISIANPEHETSTSDSSPSFEGTFEDSDSGLSADTFRLYVDNSDQTSMVFNIPSGVTPGSKSKVDIRDDYRGYSDGEPTFGVLQESELFKCDSSRTGREQCILPREFADGDSSGRFDNDVRLSFDTRDTEVDVDFQAVVLDLAGNVGFSDAHEGTPNFIGDLGEESNDREGFHNIIGWYSSHILTVDNKDPEYDEDRDSVTGFYGVDSDDDSIPNRSGVMLVFDGPIDEAGITTNTFNVELDNGNDASVVDVTVFEDRVYLRLSDDLDPDETPEVTLSGGAVIEDLAGNESNAIELSALELKDGIEPGLTVELSNGTGTGSSTEGPDRLTRDTIRVRITSDEQLQGAPRIAALCSNVVGLDDKNNTDDSDDVESDIDDYVQARSGGHTSDPNQGDPNSYECGSGSDAREFTPTVVTGQSRPGFAWEYTWRNRAGSNVAIPDGDVTVVAWGRDRANYEDLDGDNVNNYGSAKAEFRLDTTFDLPPDDDQSWRPSDGATIREQNPFLLIDFVNEGTTVTIDVFKIDDRVVTDQLESQDNRRFIYFPQSLNFGDHEVEVEARDAAGNELSFTYEFTSEARGPFLIKLSAGWNAISLPSDPVSSELEAVFTDPAVTSVLGWNARTPDSPWRFASRQDGIWTTSGSFATLSEVEARYGYWVHSTRFFDQPVQLQVYERSGATPTLVGIDTIKGWNFVGVIDVDGDQTEDHWGVSLTDHDDKPVIAEQYLRDYVRAYTWNPTFSRFESIENNDDMTIGQGVWVFYGDSGIAP